MVGLAAPFTPSLQAHEEAKIMEIVTTITLELRLARRGPSARRGIGHTTVYAWNA